MHKVKFACPSCMSVGKKVFVETDLTEGDWTWTGKAHCEQCGVDMQVEMEKCRICGDPIEVMEVCDNCAADNLADVDLEGPGGWMVQDGSGRPY